jgi:hypothetical protein
MGRKANSPERFWSHVKRGPKCWLWLLACNHDGYGKTTYKHRFISAHRFAWELTLGKVPGSKCVLHKCDNPPCVRPSHLFLGTHQDNQNDRHAKGRQGDSRPKNPAKGERNSSAKLNEATVRNLRREYHEGASRKLLMRKYNVSRHCVWSVGTGRSWSHVS